MKYFTNNFNRSIRSELDNITCVIPSILINIFLSLLMVSKVAVKNTWSSQTKLSPNKFSTTFIFIICCIPEFLCINNFELCCYIYITCCLRMRYYLLNIGMYDYLCLRWGRLRDPLLNQEGYS